VPVTTEGSAETARRRFATLPREGEQVTPLELFFDLVFVLALTQCTQLMSDDPTWGGIGQGLLVLAASTRRCARSSGR
jgi:low temperature requirement protein LtrA